MPNPLTGDFAAVVQIAVPQIDGLLAMLHQYGANSGAPLKLLHSARLRIGHERPRPDLAELGDWVATASLEQGSPGRDEFRTDLVTAAPAGVARHLEAALASLDNLFEITELPTRGTASTQISNVRVTFAPGATGEVTVHAGVRAVYTPEPDTAALPAPIHGQVEAAFTIQRRTVNGVRRLEIKASGDDAKIRFVPAAGSGVTPAQAGPITTALRRTLRSGLTLLPVELPAAFPFGEFVAIGQGQSQVLALPLSLSGSPPVGSVHSLSQSFVAGHGIAAAISADHVRSLIDLEAIKDAISQRSFTLRLRRFGVGVSVTYRLRFSSGPTLTFAPAVIEVSGRVAAETSTWWAPNGFVSFRQRLTLVLDRTSQIVHLATAGPPVVDESWFIPHSRAVSIVTTEIGRAVTANAPEVRRIFDDTRARFVSGLRRFDPAASMAFDSLQISAEGVVVRGEIRSAAVQAPVVGVRDTNNGAAISAFDSWVPGGSVDRFVWTWVEYPAQSPTILSGVLRTIVDEHRYLLPRPAGIASTSQVCLRIEGTRILPSGAAVPVSGGTTCLLPEPELELAIPSWWGPLTIPVWPPDLAPEARLADAVVAHVSVQSPHPGARDPKRNTLVCFADVHESRHLQAIAETVRALGRRRGSLSILIVTPPGTLTTRREIEARLAPLAGLTPSPAQITEDQDGAWSRTFAATTAPACFLVNARREVAWSHQGEADPAELARALQPHILPVPGPERRPMRLEVAAGEVAGDVEVDDERGARFALHRHRGAPVVMVFWQTWSAPSVEELLRLQAWRDRQRDGAPVVVGLLGNDPGEDLGSVAKRLGLTVALVPDFEHRIARRYGVRCWPTSIFVDASGRVERIELGSRRRDRVGAAPGGHGAAAE